MNIKEYLTKKVNQAIRDGNDFLIVDTIKLHTFLNDINKYGHKIHNLLSDEMDLPDNDRDVLIAYHDKDGFKTLMSEYSTRWIPDNVKDLVLQERRWYLPSFYKQENVIGWMEVPSFDGEL